MPGPAGTGHNGGWTSASTRSADARTDAWPLRARPCWHGRRRGWTRASARAVDGRVDAWLLRFGAAGHRRASPGAAMLTVAMRLTVAEVVGVLAGQPPDALSVR
ncbi:hypothetical protein GCM10022214_27320 [Actinomadura miaoliensis]|uniref:Uncharacterized protein n=1 Tax=Actinomadura miaoliensis TaxID=430685 RepID=A0ABP7VM78_9ACTN